MVFGERRTPLPDTDKRRPTAGPRETLEGILLGALGQSPCVVAFSGGRDSSALLADATRVARANGLDDPIPYTLRFKQAPRTEEEDWQQLMIRHLGLENWTIRTIGDELEVLGPVAIDVLRRYGVHWPPNIHTLKIMLEEAAGGALLTGNGGDELFTGWAGHRFSLLRRGKALPRRYDIKPLVLYLLPKSALVRRSMRRGDYRLPWLMPDPALEIQQTMLEISMRIEDSWATALEEYLNGRFREVGPGISGAIARDIGADLVEPFFDPRYIRAVYTDAPPEAYSSRTAAMDRLFGDLLPAETVKRSTKAVFTEVFRGPETWRFAEEWTGSGLDPAMVDAEALRAAWLAPGRPDLRSLVPIQAAWLAANP